MAKVILWGNMRDPQCFRSIEAWLCRYGYDFKPFVDPQSTINKGKSKPSAKFVKNGEKLFAKLGHDVAPTIVVEYADEMLVDPTLGDVKGLLNEQ